MVDFLDNIQASQVSEDYRPFGVDFPKSTGLPCPLIT